MEAFFQRLIERAATIDELLSNDFEPLTGRKDDAELAARRLSAWCRAAANGDWAMFARRLERDHLSLPDVLARFATVRRNDSAPVPTWYTDAVWIAKELEGPGYDKPARHTQAEGFAFEDLLLPVVQRAETLLWAKFDGAVADVFSKSARASLSRTLLGTLSDLCAAPLYEAFSKDRSAGFDKFVADMRAGGFRRLFEERPVLLRLIATLTRQWIDSSGEFARRLGDDLQTLRRDFPQPGADTRVTDVEGGRSDRHNDGRSVLIVTFEDGARIVYKPKDLRLDVAFHGLIARLNGAAPPIELRAVRAIARQNYGWTEFVDHTGCSDSAGYDRFYRRAGAWLALLHCFAATDMHQENIIAAGDHPVPIDLETLLQSSPSVRKADEPEGEAYAAANDMIANSVMRVGLLPAFGRAPDHSVFAIGGLTSDWNSRLEISWDAINSDAMRPSRKKVVSDVNPNLPHVGGRYGKFSDHFDAFVAGFEDYAAFLAKRAQGPDQGKIFEGFAGAPVRRVVRPTRFYSMLLQRLKSHRGMEDGAIWSAEADFIARFSDWNQASDGNWPLHISERAALVTLNVPHFVSPSDGDEIRDAGGVVSMTDAVPGLARAQARVFAFDKGEIAWQAAVIRANAEPAKPPAAARQALSGIDIPVAATTAIFTLEADKIAAEVSDRAIRRGASAAWFGLDWLGDAEAYQLVCLGPDLYNGVSGIGVFLSAHTQVTGHAPSAELALQGVAYLRKKLKDRNAARFARSLGIGGAAGLGSIVYALAVMSKSLGDDALLADAHAASRLMANDMIAADKRLDVIGGSAGAILGLLRLHRDTRAKDVLARAVMCGEHLLRQDRIGTQGSRSWVGQGFGTQALNGMSHGAAGFAYALAALAEAAGREDMAIAAAECLAFENSSYDADRQNWPDRRQAGEPGWACRWCHGAPGIGMARAAMLKRGASDQALLKTDIRNALGGANQGWPSEIDTLCCGTLGSVEFLCEAAEALDLADVRDSAAQRLAAVLQAAGSDGDFRWNSGKRQFNLGMFRGLAGVGYTLLRRIDGSLPNILIWE